MHGADFFGRLEEINLGTGEEEKIMDKLEVGGTV